MRYFSWSVCNYIKTQVERYKTKEDTGKALIMLSSLPAGAMLHIGRELEAHVMPLVEQFVYKIAKPLWEEWAQSDDPVEKNCLEEAAQKGWLDDIGNLTSYRNEGAGIQKKFAAFILGGMDHVRDAGSLSDFHCCDVQTIWEWPHGMNTSFHTWIQKCFNEKNIAYEKDTLDHFNEVFQALLTRVPTDILSISEFLDTLNFSGVQDGREAEQALLKGLGFFGLPEFMEFKFGGRKQFSPYVEAAMSFFSYSMFLEKPARDKAIKAAKGYQEKYAADNHLSENNQIGNLSSDDEFFETLINYIEKEEQAAKDSLLNCEFTIIRDKVFKFKERKKKSTDKLPTVKRLGTDPIETVLTGLWITLGEFRKELEFRGVIAHDVLKEIHIRSWLFKHDCDGANQAERNENAKIYLEKIIGGIDQWLTEYISMEIHKDEEKIPVTSQLINDLMDYQYSSVAEPVLGFVIEVESIDELETVEQNFYLRLPKTSPYRIAEELFQYAREKLKSDYQIPVYAIPYFEELMLAKDEEDANRVLAHGIGDIDSRVVDLYGPISSEFDSKEKAFDDRLKALSHNYYKFVALAEEKSIYHALKENWDELRHSLEKAFEFYLAEDSPVQTDKGIILSRAFLVVNERTVMDSLQWIWQPYEAAAAVTVLHPSLLELLHARIRYLFDCFNSEAVRQLKTTEIRFFKKSTWEYYLDLSAIKMPLCGLLKDDDLIFETSIRGENLLHRIGNPQDTEAALSTRLLLRYEAFEDEDISDQEMFRETRESLMLFRILKDFWKLHPHAKDGIRLAVYQNQDIQPVIAAVDKFISDRERFEESGDAIFHVSVTLFSESNDDTGIRRWIEQWKERWEAAENHTKFAHYRMCRLSIAHRIVTPDEDYEQFRKIVVNTLEADIAILSHFVSAGITGNQIERAPVPHYVTSRPIQFPILEKTFCSSSEKRHADVRFRVLSNRQFMVASKHLEVMACLKGFAKGNYIALGKGDFSPWRKVIDALHKHVEWVVCIDSSMDEHLLEPSDQSTVRDLIGFGSGVGSHGEANYTISTEQFHFSDLLHKLKASILNVVEGWSDDDHIRAAQFAIDQAKDLSGLSLIRATGVGQHIRDVLAYALARKKFRTHEKNICDQFISLDAYRHWFDNAPSNVRPDILWLTATMSRDDTLHLEMRIIECKLGKRSEIHLEKAREQVDSGLRHLIPAFMPRQENEISERPDARYWWLQLHRLISSKSQVSSQEKEKMLGALERLADGDYSISWGAAFFTCWTNVETEEIQTPLWNFDFRDHNLDIFHVALGSKEMNALCVQEQVTPFTWGDHLFSFSFKSDVRLGIPKCEPMEEVPELLPEIPEPVIETDNETVSPVPADMGLRIPLGASSNGARQIFWEFGHKELHNRHMLIFGSSGMGKTYAIQCLLNELGCAGQNSLVVDYTNGFLPDQLEDDTVKCLSPKQHIIRQSPLPISPFKRQGQKIGEVSIPESPSSAAKRISAIFKTVYDLGDQQFSVLFDAIISGLDNFGENLILENLLEILDGFLEEKQHSRSTIQSVLSKLKPFIMEKPFAADTKGMEWSQLFLDETNRSHVFQLAGLDMYSGRLVTEFILWDLYAYVRVKGNKNLPKVVVLDEVQNLDHKEGSPLSKYLTEGRKFGLALILATQTLSNLANDQQSRLFQAAHKLFFKPAETEMKEYAMVLQNATGENAKLWIERLSRLNKGECYSLGPSLADNQILRQIAVKIRITAMEDRSINGAIRRE
jgi:DNA phosphorothioation-dependent restriction protein DptH